MHIVRITKEFTFEMAHALRNYDGPCRNIHGHSYKLFITLKGIPINDPKDPKNGMLMDFGALKKLVNQEIVSQYDHGIVVAQNDERIQAIKKQFDNIIITKYQPTCENFVVDFAQKIQSNLPEKITVHSIKLYETATSYAEWYADDNP